MGNRMKDFTRLRGLQIELGLIQFIDHWFSSVHTHQNDLEGMFKTGNWTPLSEVVIQ